MATIRDSADKVRGYLIPQLFVLRRVPMRYYRVLPLTFMKKFQCIVVGSAPGVLTVAITNRNNTLAIESLIKFTGQSIFPVLIERTRMRLLILRIERNEYRRKAFHSIAKGSMEKLNYYQYSMLSLQVCSFMRLLSSKKAKNV